MTNERRGTIISVPLGTKVVYYILSAGALLASAHRSAELMKALEPCFAVGLPRLRGGGTHQFHRVADESLEASSGHFVQVAQGMIDFDSKSTHAAEATRRAVICNYARSLILGI